jgi:Arc/MetJ-type ribon-helix-helix transcriptional regulator
MREPSTRIEFQTPAGPCAPFAALLVTCAALLGCASPPRLDGRNLGWYVLGMTKKIAISLPDESLRKARAAVKAGRAPNVSNYISRLIEDAGAEETFSEMIATWIGESGATEDELRAAEEESRIAFARAGLEARRERREKARRKAS